MTWKRRLLVFASSLLLAVAPGAARAESPVSTVRLYAIECGHMDVLDMGVFADTGEYDGKSGPLAVTCYLIRHPMGTLLWDTGLSDKLAENKDGGGVGPFKLSVKTPLIDQLKTIGVTPADVTYLAFSHFHFDHTGNANASAASTWIVNKAERACAESTPTPFGADPSAWNAGRTATTRLIDGDHDVFGDGIARAPAKGQRGREGAASRTDAHRNLRDQRRAERDGSAADGEQQDPQCTLASAPRGRGAPPARPPARRWQATRSQRAPYSSSDSEEGSAGARGSALPGR